MKAGFSIGGTWPMRTELMNRMTGSGTNALASSVVLVCQKRPTDAPTTSRRDFIRELRLTLPDALDAMTSLGGDEGTIAPVDLSQAVIGPGMAVFSRYGAVLEGDGSPMPVKTALALINKEVDAYLHAGEGDLDAETRFCLDWFAQNGWQAGEFGSGDTLARAKGTSVEKVRETGVAQAERGIVRLLKPAEYADGQTADGAKLSVWFGLHQLIRVFQAGGESGAAALLGRLHEQQPDIRLLAYRLYQACERKGWAEEARSYNELIAAWEPILATAEAQSARTDQQMAMFT